MAKVLKIGIAEKPSGSIVCHNSVEAIKGKGLLHDRHYKEINDKRSQVTLIESENINYFNSAYGLNIPYIGFRRNIITQGVKLNKLLGKIFFLGEVKVKAHDLCRPCKHLQEILNHKNIIKEFLLKGGIRCEILSNGKIYINDIIKNYD